MAAPSEEIEFVIDWTLDQVQFRAQIRKMIKMASENGKVLTLPLFPEPGRWALDLLTLILSQVNCEGCDTPCCKSNPNGENTDLIPADYRRIKELYGDEGILYKDGQHYLKMPCRFLKGNRCQIYPDRPFVCQVYPFNPGGSEGMTNRRFAMSLESRCPEARRITKAIYMTQWRLRQSYWAMGAEDMAAVINGR